MTPTQKKSRKAQKSVQKDAEVAMPMSAPAGPCGTLSAEAAGVVARRAAHKVASHVDTAKVAAEWHLANASARKGVGSSLPLCASERMMGIVAQASISVEVEVLSRKNTGNEPAWEIGTVCVGQVDRRPAPQISAALSRQWPMLMPRTFIYGGPLFSRWTRIGGISREPWRLTTYEETEIRSPAQQVVGEWTQDANGVWSAPDKGNGHMAERVRYTRTACQTIPFAVLAALRRLKAERLVASQERKAAAEARRRAKAKGEAVEEGARVNKPRSLAYDAVRILGQAGVPVSPAAVDAALDAIGEKPVVRSQFRLAVKAAGLVPFGGIEGMATRTYGFPAGSQQVLGWNLGASVPQGIGFPR